MKTKLLILIFSFLILTACGTSKPIATVHHERIETQLQPIPISADTIEITLSRDAACCVRSTSGSKNNVTSVEIQRALLTKSNSESSNPNGKKSFQSVLSVGEKNNSEGVKSVDHRLLTIDNIKSTRGMCVKTTQTDTTQTLRITLKPDTIFVPYVHHIRSDTIVAPDPTTKTKMQKTQTANLLLILIIIAIIIIFFDRMTKGHNL